jgi:hypothetical protein
MCGFGQRFVISTARPSVTGRSHNILLQGEAQTTCACFSPASMEGTKSCFGAEFTGGQVAQRRLRSQNGYGSLFGGGIDPAWRRRAPHILREQGGLVHAIRFQGSQFGSKDEGSFTVNLSVSSKPIYEAWTGRPFPANPATALFPIQERIGHFMEERRDHWWQVTESSNMEKLSLSVAATVVRVADTFFNRYASIEAMLDELRATGTLPGLTKHQAPVIHGIIAAIQNQPHEVPRRPLQPE